MGKEASNEHNLGMKGFLKRLTKGPARHLDYFERYISWLINKGYSNGTLIIEHVSSERFVQFQKYVLSEKNFGIEMSFPNAKWSKSYFDDLVSYCSSNGHKYRIVDGSNGMQFLDIDFGTDELSAFRFAGHVFENVFGHTETEKYYGCLENCRVK